ncbi:MAG: 4a-hydroxytetrahydrobiopterin dehydratase [Chlorobiales bacterium]|jgi:4a-hydroxytetrahydrobiopterin dehydratase|nr:4a-hydroxytetrahydrobiopterin dehydratase [Chlorobiales bacterium]
MKTALLNQQEISEHLSTLQGWSVKDNKFLEKKYSFSGKQLHSPFMMGLLFVERVAGLAEAANHHPDITLTYPSVLIQLTTHDSGGLTEKDFTLAGQIEAVA